MPAASRPDTIQGYLHWATSTLSVDFGAAATRNRYEANVQAIQNAIQDSAFLRDLNAFLEQHGAECKRSTGATLLLSPEFTVLRKPFSSALEKSFRANVVMNRSFPNAPKDGWITPDNWYTRFDDLVRGTLVCKFLDGPDFLAQGLDRHAASYGLTARHVARSTERGYYAFHHYTAFRVDINDASFNTQAISAELEIQLTTQLQEVLRQLTHPLYEQARTKAPDRDERWKWDYETPRFKSTYLGHTLHLIEAIILQVRDDVAPKPGESSSNPIPSTVDSATADNLTTTDSLNVNVAKGTPAAKGTKL